MTYFHSVVDSPEQVQSWFADTWRWNTTAAGATESRIDIDEPPGGPVVIGERGRRHRAGVPRDRSPVAGFSRGASDHAKIDRLIF